ncbi:MAG: hypothetical protein M3071_21180 [Actinomycetota bacterium]|nr:hypothetical protein [Actinomycetota bacterium]
MDPEQVILEELARPPGELAPGPVTPGGWRAGTVHGGALHRADPDSVRFVKHRASSRRRIDFVTFRGSIPMLDHSEHDFVYFFALEREPDGGWRIVGAAGGGGSSPVRGRPWVNLAGGHGGDLFYTGGQIERAGTDIDRVQIRFADGRFVEDDVEQDVALFIDDAAVLMLSTVVLLDGAGAEVAKHEAFPG